MARQPKLGTPPKPRWRPRFSLLSLLCGVVLLASGGGLHARWEPWVLQGKLPDAIDPKDWHLTADSRWCTAITVNWGKGVRIFKATSFDLGAVPPAQAYVLSHEFGASTPIVQYGGDRMAITRLTRDSRTPLCVIHDLALRRQIFELATPCAAFELSPDGATVAFVPEARPSTLFLQPPESTAAPTQLQHDMKIDRVLFGATPGEIITISGAQLHYWDLQPGKLLRTAPFTGDPFNCILSPGKSRLLSLGNGRAIVLELKTGAEVAALQTAYLDQVVFLGEDRCLLRAHTSWGAQLWDFKTGTASEILTKLKLSDVGATARGDRWLCSIDEVHSKLALFDSQTLAPVFQFPPQSIWTHNSMSSDGNTILLSVIRSEAGLAADDPACGAFVYRRRRPEYWWGLFWLPESWLGLAALSGLLLSVLRAPKNKTRTAPDALPAS